MKQSFFLGLLVIGIYFPGCKKAEDDKSISPSERSISLFTQGHISLFDKNNQAVPDFSGMNVSVENSNPVIKVPVNANGEFQLPKLNSSGPMELIFSHAGYGTVKQYYTQSHLDSITKGITKVGDISLFPISSVVLNSLSGTLNGDTFKMTCNVSVPDANSSNGVSFFIQKNNSKVSFADYTGDTSVSRFFTIPVTNGDNTNSLCIKCSKDCGFIKSGDTVYIKGWGFNINSYTSNYVNPLTNKVVFPNINSNSNSPTIWFVVP